MDWYSRYVLSWSLSITLDSWFCVEALRRALTVGRPQIFNSDQGSQFTSEAFTSILQQAGVMISMDGRGQVFDNIFVERLWRSVKYEEVYLKDYGVVDEARRGLSDYFALYNTERLHQSLGYKTPAEVYSGYYLKERTFWSENSFLNEILAKIKANCHKFITNVSFCSF
jgi:putative transposase